MAFPLPQAPLWKALSAASRLAPSPDQPACFRQLLAFTLALSLCGSKTGAKNSAFRVDLPLFLSESHIVLPKRKSRPHGGNDRWGVPAWSPASSFLSEPQRFHLNSTGKESGRNLGAATRFQTWPSQQESPGQSFRPLTAIVTGTESGSFELYHIAYPGSIPASPFILKCLLRDRKICF